MNLTLDTFKEVHFLVVAESTDHAEILSNGLRNSGIVARYKHVDSPGNLDSALTKANAYEVVLIDRDTALPLDAVLKQINDVDLPSIVLASWSEPFLLSSSNVRPESSVRNSLHSLRQPAISICGRR